MINDRNGVPGQDRHSSAAESLSPALGTAAFSRRIAGSGFRNGGLQPPKRSIRLKPEFPDGRSAAEIPPKGLDR